VTQKKPQLKQRLQKKTKTIFNVQSGLNLSANSASIHWVMMYVSCVCMASLLSRVTRLGEFSPIGWFFTVGNLLIFFTVKCIVFYQEMVWASFWATFSQTHLVTLLLTNLGTYLHTNPLLLSQLKVGTQKDFSRIKSFQIQRTIYLRHSSGGRESLR
jgi:hypothetical protein